MPELNFVLPHWLYWSGLVVFPLLAILVYRFHRSAFPRPAVSLPLSYFFLLSGGFFGVHRLYLKSAWALAFIALFIGILFVNVEVRISREAMSGVNNSIHIAEGRLQRAEKALAKGRRGAEQRIQQARERLQQARSEQAATAEADARWDRLSDALAYAMLTLLVIDALLLPRLVKRRNQIEPPVGEENVFCPAVEAEHDDDREPFLFSRVVSRLNGLTGEFVAYWSLIAVFVYYYEVIARYVFNSPTNWAHESMFLMFGMQYLLAGGFVLREGAHVRVDVLYQYLPMRGKALVDILTSVFFFIFTLTLLFTGWTFFHDAFEVGEVSFTEWAIPYWPVKFALPLGAALLLLQGIAQLLKDIAAFLHPGAVELDTEVRPET